jgi:hypothetical protein
MFVLSLAGCFLLSQPEPQAHCDAPHLWYAPDDSGDVYFGCAPPEGWVRTPPDEHEFASLPTAPPPPDTDTGSAPTDGWVPPPPPDTTVSPPDTSLDTGWIDTAGTGDTADTAANDTGLGGPPQADDTADTGLPPVDTADTGLLDTGWDTGAPQLQGEAGVVDTGLPVDTGQVDIGEIPLRDDEIAVETPEGVRVLSPADTGYWMELDELNAPR